MISLFFIEFIRVGGGERFRIDDSQSLDFIYDTASRSVLGMPLMLLLSPKNQRHEKVFLCSSISLLPIATNCTGPACKIIF